MSKNESKWDLRVKYRSFTLSSILEWANRFAGATFILQRIVWSGFFKKPLLFYKK